MSRFMFCTHELVFDGTEDVGSRLHILCSRTRFGRYRGCRVQFAYFALPDPFSFVQMASGPVFIFCALILILNGIDGVGSRFNVLRSGAPFRRYRGCRVSFFVFLLSRTRFGRYQGSRVVLHSRTRFRRYRGRQVSFACFVLPDSFWPVPRTSGLVFIFCAPAFVFDGTEGVGSRFHFLLSRTHFGQYRGSRVLCFCFALLNSFSTVSRRRVPFSCFSLPD
jgi:hypothetical protein